MNIPLEIINKILLYRPSNNEIKIIKQCIQNYEDYLEKNFKKANYKHSFQFFYFFVHENGPQKIVRYDLDNSPFIIDINYIYEWMKMAFTKNKYNEITYNKENAYNDLMKNNLLEKFLRDHRYCYYDIRIYSLNKSFQRWQFVKDKINKYIDHCRLKILKNFFTLQNKNE